MESYGKRIKTAREAVHMTQEELGSHLGITGVAIMRYEKEQQEPSLQTMRDIASVLKVSVSYLIGEPPELLSHELQQAFLDILQNRIESQLLAADPCDIIECTGTSEPYEDIFNPKGALSLERLKEISDELGVPLEYLISGKSDPTDRYTFISDELQHRLDTADTRLLDTVHRICGMNPRKSLSEKDWNPEKIDIVCEYIKDSQAILKKMISAAEAPAGADGK